MKNVWAMNSGGCPFPSDFNTLDGEKQETWNDGWGASMRHFWSVYLHRILTWLVLALVDLGLGDNEQ